MVGTQTAEAHPGCAAARLHDVEEHFAAGYMAAPDEATVVRFAMGIAAYLEHVTLPAYAGEPFYPCADPLYWRGNAVEWHYSSCMCYDATRLAQKLEQCTDEPTREALVALREAQTDYPRVGGYTHSIPNYRRVLTEGLDSYAGRIEVGRQTAERRGEPRRIDFARAMAIVLAAVQTLHRRSLDLLRAWEAADEEQGAARDRLVAALERVPRMPARNLYEAMVGINFILYVDGPDDLGRFDQDLTPYYLHDQACGQLPPEPVIVGWIKRIWQNMDRCGAWNVAVGGLLEDGTSGISELTRLCVKAVTGLRRPNLALRLHREAPEWIWDAALDAIAAGGGLPALYNEEAYVAAVRDAHLGVSERDLPDFAFGGCTELMIHGKSNCGSLEGDVNLPQVLVQTLHEKLPDCGGFDDFMARYKRDLAAHIRDLTHAWDANQERKARWQPQVMRSLLIDDCIDNVREYNDGGARYNWCVVNVMGLANVVDSLAALREAVYERGDVSVPTLLAALAADFVGHEDLRRRLEACPHFGNDNSAADDLAADISAYVFHEFRRHAPWRGGRYVPACLMFVTYAHYGKPVGATPDGRHAGEPIADSAGAMQGRDRSGPTALLRSVSRIRHHLAPGTLVVNARFAHKYFTQPDTREKLTGLIRTYFDLGGMQLQVNVVDQQTLQDAYEHPERHGDLILRVGGYSEYWTRLDDDLRRSILQRIEHE